MICWETKEVCQEMNRAYDEFRAEQSQRHHIMVLNELIPQGKMIDVGCGTGLSSLFAKGEYSGCDLPHILAGCAMVKSPGYWYRACDLFTDSFEWINGFDVVLTNGVIDVMENPLVILDKLLSQTSNYFILHRQEMTNRPTKSIKKPSYNSETYHSLINWDEFKSLLDKHCFSIEKQLVNDFADWEGDGHSFLLKKNRSWGVDGLDHKLNKYFVGKENGFFVEAGANNGVRQSNTMYFEFYKNWIGILIEPIRMLADECKENRSARSRVENVALVAPEQVGTVNICYTPKSYGLMSILDGEGTNAQLMKAGESEIILQEVRGVTLDSVLEKYRFDKIDLLVLDLEGQELNALKGLTRKPEYILVEVRESGEEIEKQLSDYELIETLPNDYLFRHIP